MVTPARIVLVLAVALLAGCGGGSAVKKEPFRADTPFSARISGTGESVCWSVKRAVLTQGYMLDRAETLIMIGTKDAAPDDETDIVERLQATCVDNHDGTSTVFATAERETHKLQKVGYSTTTGVSIATISLPSGTERSLRLQKRETIQDPAFYRSFYALVQKFADEDRAKNPPRASGG